MNETSHHHPVGNSGSGQTLSFSMSGVAAVVFEERYGELARTEHSEYTSHRALRTVLAERQPPIDVSDGALQQWMNKNDQGAGGRHGIEYCRTAGEVRRRCQRASKRVCNGVSSRQGLN